MTQQDRFESVPLGTYEETSATPSEPDEDWTGLLIDAPTVVLLEPAETPGTFVLPSPIPLCGRVKLLILETPKHESVRIFAAEVGAKASYAGTVGDTSSDDTEPDPDEPLDDSLFEGVLASSFFNIDLAATVDLPAVPATYRVRAQLGEYSSNVHMIEVRVP